MAQASQLTRYRGAVLAFTGVACGIGIYLVYSTYYHQPDKSSLHRSNAVHRPRADRAQQPKLEATPPDNEAPLGTLIIRRGQHVHATNLAFDQLPTSDTLAGALGVVPAGTLREVRQFAVFCILLNCSRPSELRDRLTGTALAPLPAAMDLRTVESLGRVRQVLASHIPGLEEEIVDEAIQAVVAPNLMEASATSSSYGTGADIAETEDFEGSNGSPREPSQGIKGLLYYIAEEDAKRKAYEHRGIGCEECGEAPIRGIRWHCLNCPDFDLCSTCEAQTVHQNTHVLAKIKIPMPVLSQPSQQYPLWYPGDARKIHSSLDAGVRKRLAQQYAFEEPSVDALYDQFTCIANVPWTDDPTKVQTAIDTRAFNKALTPDRWSSRLAPNAMYDRMFAFYDTDSNGLIGLEEFVSGISYLRGPKRLSSIARALKGFDIDGDRFVERSDFLRIFRAKYNIQQQLVADMVEGHEADQTMAAMDILRSSQPISSLFCQEEIPQGEIRPQSGKQMDAFDDMQPLPGVETILDDTDPWPPKVGRRRAKRGDPIGADRASGERLQHHLSRFEEMLYGSSDVQSSPQHEPEHDDQVDGPQTHDDNHSGQNNEAAGTTVSQDALLQIVEDGLNEMLDPIFKAKEQEHRDAINSRDERQQWREEIGQALREKQAFQDELQTAATVDPLMATAMESYADLRSERKRDDVPEPPFKAEIVPTDSDSLTRREAEVAEKSLEELLEATGYSARDGEPAEKPHSRRLSVTRSSEDVPTNTAKHGTGTSSRPCPSVQSRDPTMPQHRPNAEPPSSTRESVPRDGKEKLDSEERPPQTIPSRQRLEYLATLDDVEREIDDRGGPGRLSLDEVEQVVRMDATKELRGLVVSWLEFASF